MATRKFLYIGADGVENESSGAFESSDFLNTSAGAGDAGKPIVLDAGGHVDATMINDADIDHANITNTHNLTTDIDHDTLTNTHNLTTDIDHDQLTNFAANEHYLQSAITQTGTVSSGTWASTITVDTISELTPAAGVTIDGTELKDGGIDLAASASLSVNGTAILADAAGTMTLSNIDAIDATTETTLEAAIDSLVNLTTVGTITSGTWNGSAVGVAYGGTGATTILGAQQNLNLEVGVDVQAYDVELAALAGLTSAANKIPYFTGSGTASLFDFIDDDTMATATATSLASAESIKAYVDATAQGLAVHEPVRLATTADLAYTYYTLSNTVGATNAVILTVSGGTGTFDPDAGETIVTSTGTGTIIAVDNVTAGSTTKIYLGNITTGAISTSFTSHSGGVTGLTISSIEATSPVAILVADAVGVSDIDSTAVVANDRILVKNQTAALENGIYVVDIVGTASLTQAFSRALDFDNSPGQEIHDGDFFFVGEGTLNSHNGYVQTEIDPITIGTDAINFSQFSGAGQITAGVGLYKSGNDIKLSLDEMVTGAISSADYLIFTDGVAAPNASNEKITVTNFVEAIDGSGIVANAGVLDLSLNDLSAAVVDVTADSIAILDATDSTTKLESIADLATGMAGVGIAAASGVLSLKFSELTPDTIDVTADSLAFLDATDSSTKTTTVPAFVGAIAGTGIADTGSNGTLDLALSELTQAVVDVSTDFIAIQDTTDNSTKKEAIADLISAVAGSGLTATSGVLSVNAIGLSDLTDADTTGVADGHILIYDGVTDNRFESKAVTGDVTISAAGVTTIGADTVDDTMINWGTGAGQVSATDMPIADAGTYYTTDTVEGVASELATQIGGDTSTTFNFTEANVLTDNDAVYAALEKLDLKWGDLASIANNEGASLVGVEDSSGYFSGTDVEAVLAELYGLATAGSAVTYTAGTGGVSKGDLVYASANNTVLPYDTITAYENVIGTAQAAATVGNPVTVLANDNIVSSLFVALTNIAALPSAGDTVYWWGNGGTYDFTTSLTDFSAGDYIYLAGVAKNTTDLHVQNRYLMKKA